MAIIKVEFQTGTYNKPCEKYKDRMVGSVLCVGKEPNLKKCEYCKDFKVNKKGYYLPILKEWTPITSKVNCIALNQTKLEL